MSNFVKFFFANDNPASLKKIFISLSGIIFVRIFLEIYSSPTSTGLLSPPEGIFLHIPLYYFSTFFSFSLVIYFFTKEKFATIFDFLAKAFTLMWLVPIADLIYSRGAGAQISFVITEFENIPAMFFKLMNPFGYAGITFGIHIGSYFLLSLIAFYIFKKTGNFFKSFSAIFICYTLLFFYALIPTLAIIPLTIDHLLPATQAFSQMLFQSWTGIALGKPKTISGFLDSNLYLNNIFVSQVFWVLVVVQIAIILSTLNSHFWKAIKACIRPERVLNFLLLGIIGMMFTGKNFSQFNLENGANFFTMLTFILLIILNSILASFINDEEDIKIDKISNPTRPLAKKEISLSQWHEVEIYLAILILFGTLTLNVTSAFFLILTQAVYYIYSVPPLRLKRHFVSSSILVGMATVFVAMSGFFLLSSDKKILAFSLNVIFLIGIAQAILSNMKDIKDFEGDKQANIATLPVIFGLKKSKRIIALLYALVFIGLSIILKNFVLFFFALILSIATYYFLNYKKYSERNIFIILFIYMILLFLNL